MRRRDFIKATGATTVMGGLAGCNSIIHEYYEPALADVDKFEMDYEQLLSQRVRIIQRHEILVNRLGCQITFNVNSNSQKQSIDYRRENAGRNHSLFKKTTNSNSTTQEVIDVYSTNRTLFQRIQYPEKDTEYSREPTNNVYLYTGRSTLLSWLDSIQLSYESSQSMNSTTLHQYNVRTFDGDPVTQGLLSVNDRGLILEFELQTKDYYGHFNASNFDSISFEQPVWTSQV